MVPGQECGNLDASMVHYPTGQAVFRISAVVLLLCVGAGVVAQTLKGYPNYELGLYGTEFFVIDRLRFVPLIVLSMLVHTLVNNKYLAFFVFVALLMLNAYIWTLLDVRSNTPT